MKPSWSDAPEWAKYLAMDATGWWFWYEKQPIVWMKSYVHGGKLEPAAIPDSIDWRDTLEPRPLDSSTPS